uniref:Uncharacterized protein n=1 Tax=Anguilla anguilla TaxID=7936 RepID=A0A0E9VUM9_ANGAN
MLFLCKVSACIYTCSVCYLCVIFKCVTRLKVTF